MATIEELEVEINKIKARNLKVEGDKAWESSLARKLIITVFTYVIVVIFFFFVGLPKPFINAIVPALAFIISTLSISLFKKWWILNIYKK